MHLIDILSLFNIHFHLQTIKELDREKQDTYTLIIKATENCAEPPEPLEFNRPEALSNVSEHEVQDLKIVLNHGNNRFQDQFERYKTSKSLEAPTPDYYRPNNAMSPQFESYNSGGMLVIEDSTLVRIVIHVLDINDNAPQFVSKVFTGGVTTATTFGAEFMKLAAIDLDEGLNGKISYYQVGEIQKTLAEGLDNLKIAPFLVDRETGYVMLNFYPQKGMKGYFDFTVLVNDTSDFKDTAHVFIYLLREDQRVRFVLRQHPEEVRANIEKFRGKLSNVTNAIVNIDDFKIHENKDGTYDKTKTDLFLHLVDRKDNSILEVAEVLRLIDQNIEDLDGLFKEFNVLDTQAAEALPLISEIGPQPMLVYLLVSNLFLGALLIVILVVCATQRTNYRRQLRAAKVNTYGKIVTTQKVMSTGLLIYFLVTAPSDLSARMPRVPGTNKHSVEGSNPMWMRNIAAYDNNWYKSDEEFDTPSNEDGGTDSIDENVLTADDYFSKKELKTIGDITRQYNVYQQIDKMTNGALLVKKLETTEL